MILPGTATLTSRFAASALNTLVATVALLVGWGAALHPPSSFRTTVLTVVVLAFAVNALRQLWSLSRKRRRALHARAAQSLVVQTGTDAEPDSQMSSEISEE